MSKEGRLSWKVVFRLAFKNLYHSRSRSLVTIGGMAIGTAAVVFLVSFGFGLQKIVNNKLIQPNSMRLADVQSGSTALSLDKQAIDTMRQIDGVEDVAPAVSLAGSLQLDESKLDIVVMSVTSSFMNYAHLEPIEGTLFAMDDSQLHLSQGNAETELGALQDLVKHMNDEGAVAGMATDEGSLIGIAVSNDWRTFRIKDDVYVPLRSSPESSSKVIGYVRGGVFNVYKGKEVWGDVYQSVGVAGRAYVDSMGNWYGRWIDTKVPVYQETAPTVYELQRQENGSQVVLEGYVAQVDLYLLSPEEAQIVDQTKKVVEQTSNAAGEVLGTTILLAQADITATDSADTAATDSAALLADTATPTASAEGNLSVISYSESSKATEAAALADLVTKSEDDEKKKQQQTVALLDFPERSDRQALVSTGVLRVWDLEPKDIIGKTVDLSYIFGSGIVKDLNGRVVSKPVPYTIVGVIKDDSRQIIFTPLQDVLDVGVQRFTLAKILAKNEIALKAVRERVEALGYSTQSIVDTLAQVNKLFVVMRFLLGSFGMIAFIVAVVGMFNTLTVSLLERTREIGVMKTLGTTDADVMRMMFAESMMIGLLGGLSGIFLGVGLGNGINLLGSFFREDRTINLFVTPFEFMVLIFVFSVVIGLVTGFYPSQRAKRISALNALRYE